MGRYIRWTRRQAGQLNCSAHVIGTALLLAGVTALVIRFEHVIIEVVKLLFLGLGAAVAAAAVSGAGWGAVRAAAWYRRRPRRGLPADDDEARTCALDALLAPACADCGTAAAVPGTPLCEGCQGARSRAAAEFVRGIPPAAAEVPVAPDNREPADRQTAAELARVLGQTGQWAP